MTRLLLTLSLATLLVGESTTRACEGVVNLPQSSALEVCPVPEPSSDPNNIRVPFNLRGTGPVSSFCFTFLYDPTQLIYQGAERVPGSGLSDRHISPNIIELVVTFDPPLTLTGDDRIAVGIFSKAPDASGSFTIINSNPCAGT